MNGNELSTNNDLTPAQYSENADIGMPLDGGEVLGEQSLEGFMTSGSSSRKLNGGVLMIVGVVLIAVAGLFSMRKHAKATAVATIDPALESQIEKFLDSVKDETDEASHAIDDQDDEVLAILTGTYSERQIPIEDVQRDPFVIPDVDGQDDDAGPTDDGSAAAAEAERQKREALRKRRETIERAGAGLTLKAIMGGREALAIIGGQTARTGDTVAVPNSDVTFTVDSIARGTVVLVATEDVEVLPGETSELVVTVMLTLNSGS